MIPAAFLFFPSNNAPLRVIFFAWIRLKGAVPAEKDCAGSSRRSPYFKHLYFAPAVWRRIRAR